MIFCFRLIDVMRISQIYPAVPFESILNNPSLARFSYK